MKKWMIVFKKRNAILLHLNEEYPQYDKFKRVDHKMLNKLIKNAETNKGVQNEN